MVGDRRLLLADEPSGALDSVNAEGVMRLIHNACKRGVAAVVVTHDAQLASWADKVVFLRDGRAIDQTAVYGHGAQTFVTPGNGNGPPNGPQTSFPCPAGSCLANPKIQEVGALPSGTSAPNTVITEHAVHQFGLQPSTAGWLIQTPHPPTAAQITNARRRGRS